MDFAVVVGADGDGQAVVVAKGVFLPLRGEPAIAGGVAAALVVAAARDVAEAA